MKKDEHSQAVLLRKKGFSVKEISKAVGVSKGTASLWLRDVSLSPTAQKRLLLRITAGQLQSARVKKERVQKHIDQLSENALAMLSRTVLTKAHREIICSLLYVCEGSKDMHGIVVFVNSDPLLVRLFMQLFTESFPVDRRKFRLCLHLHNYHNVEKEKVFWSRITGIPLSQFTKPFIKTNAGRRIHEGYHGCASVRYQNTDIARRLLTNARVFLQYIGGNQQSRANRTGV